MATRVDIANLALAKLGTSRVSSLDPPTTPNERLFALLLPQYTDSELRANNWNFARQLIQLTALSGASADINQPYRYALPTECLRPLRQKLDDWTLMGRELWSASPDGLTLLCVIRPPDTSLYDPLFVDVMIGRLAYEACEQVTNSNEKKKDAGGAYQDALEKAKKANAFERFPDDNQANDDSFSWISVRGNGLSGLWGS